MTIQFKDLQPLAYKVGFLATINGKLYDQTWQDASKYWIEIRWRGPNAWAIVNYSGSVLDKHGFWVYEPMPSNRSDEYLLDTRYPTPEAALEAINSQFSHLIWDPGNTPSH